ncbi:MAG TPA: polysaccharide deacetylase family protein [Candidatus Chromulinivoraceae bacterium]|nr:polysaccharide deacetylase family protein [Candidatus Chromulinivoraceae bacterium]
MLKIFRRKRHVFLFVAGLVVIVAIASVLWPMFNHSGTPPVTNVPQKQVQPVQPKQVVSTPVPVVHDVLIPPVVNGYAPVISRIDTKEPVVFLGIDDGANKQAFELQMMKDNNIKASLFLADSFIHSNPGFFKDFMGEGSLIEDHTVDHKDLALMSYESQKQEICDQADKELQYYGRRPIIMRPPGGNYNKDTPRAAAACGMKAVVQWIAKANGGSMQYQIGHGLRAGDIVLMHFRPEFKSDMQSFLDAEKAAGLHTELLEDWLPS